MRWTLVILLIPILLALPANASNDALFTMEEDSFFQTETRLNEILNLDNGTIVTVHSYQEEVSVTIDDGYLNISATSNWNGIATIGYNYIEDETLVDKDFSVNITPVNDDPEIANITLSGDPDSLINPVAFSVSFTDIDDDTITVTWYLDGEEIGNGIHGQRYIYPDQNDLTVVIDDGNGGTDSMSVTLHTIPPEGWGDEPDNTRNRIIFWTIFGSAGLILLAAMVWVLFKPERIDKTEKNMDQ